MSRLYARLAHESDFVKIDLGPYLREVCRDLAESAPGCEIHADVEEGIWFDPERAIYLALIVNELVTNACKYAHAGTGQSQVWLRASRDGKSLRLSVRDEGVGLPADFDISASTGLGMRIVTALTGQLGATFTAIKSSRGAEFLLVVPAP